MKVYVCYVSYPYEGCSSPMEAFDSEEKAKAWMKEQSKDRSIDPDYMELDVE